MGTSLPSEEDNYLYLVSSGSVKQSIGLHQFLQQILQGKNDSYLCRDELSIGTAEPAPWSTTTSFVAGRGHERGYASKFFFGLPATKYVLCDACASSASASPWLPVSQTSPRERAAQKGSCSAAVGAARGPMVLVSERRAHCYKIMEIGLKRTRVAAIDLAVRWEPMKSRANGWAAEQKKLFRLHVAKEHLSAWETWPVDYHAVAHSGYLLSQFNFLFFP